MWSREVERLRISGRIDVAPRSFGNPEQEHDLIADPGRGRVEHRLHLESGLERRYVTRCEQWAVANALAEGRRDCPLTRLHAADGRQGRGIGWRDVVAGVI
jgi:hypothetical protein